jgi:hypothetical protein
MLCLPENNNEKKEKPVLIKCWENFRGKTLYSWNPKLVFKHFLLWKQQDRKKTPNPPTILLTRSLPTSLRFFWEMASWTTFMVLFVFKAQFIFSSFSNKSIHNIPTIGISSWTIFFFSYGQTPYKTEISVYIIYHYKSVEEKKKKSNFMFNDVKKHEKYFSL